MVVVLKDALGVGAGTSADLTVALVARDRFARYLDCEFEKNYSVDDDPTSGRAELEDVFLDRVDTRLKATLESTVEGPMSRILRSLMGAEAITTPGGGILSRDHTITLADTVPTNGRLSFEKKVGTSSHAFAAPGIVNKVEHVFDQSGMSRWTVEAVCGKPEYVAAATAVTLPGVATRLSRRMATTTLFGLADNALAVRGGRWSLERVLDEDDFTINSLFRRDAEYTRFKARWSLDVLYVNADQARRAWGSATATSPQDTVAYYAAKIVHAHPTVIEGALKYQVTADFPRSHIMVSKPQRAGEQIVMRVDGTATYDSGTSKAADVVLRNTQTS